ncbi:MAG: hypothetical protein JXR96_13095 [Deltaproteobacteria bacterium]|nr:hypothetical protein [Deltaproteobacteria bacterium]
MAAAICGIFLLVACADYVGPQGQPDGSDGLAGEDRDAGSDAGADAEPAEFCSGVARVRVDEVQYDSVTVTSEQLIMNCCEGAFLHFHLSDMNLVVMIKFAGGMWEPFEIELDGDGADPIVSICLQEDPWDCAPLAGWLKVECEDDDCYESGFKISLCGTVTDPTPFQELAFWVERLQVLPYSWWERWGIYLLEDDGIDAAEAADMPLSSLSLRFEPQIDLGGIAYYSGSSHTMVFSTWLGSGLLRNLPELGVRGVPFVVVVDEQPVYLGAFYSSLSSTSFDHPVILVDEVENTYSAVIHRSYAGHPGSPDPRSDTRIFQLFREAGKLAP